MHTNDTLNQLNTHHTDTLNDITRLRDELKAKEDLASSIELVIRSMRTTNPPIPSMRPSTPYIPPIIEGEHYIAVVSSKDGRVMVTTSSQGLPRLINRTAKRIGDIDYSRSVVATVRTKAAMIALRQEIAVWQRDRGNETGDANVFKPDTYYQAARFIAFARDVFKITEIDWHQGEAIDIPASKIRVDGCWSMIGNHLMSEYRRNHDDGPVDLDNRPMTETDAVRSDLHKMQHECAHQTHCNKQRPRS